MVVLRPLLRIIKWIFNTTSSFNRFNGVFSRDNSPKRGFIKIKDGTYIINLDEYCDIGTHWVALYVQNNNNNVIYFDSFGVEHIPKEIRAFINNINNNNKNMICGWITLTSQHPLENDHKR